MWQIVDVYEIWFKGPPILDICLNNFEDKKYEDL